MEALPPPPDGDVDLRGQYMGGIIAMTVIAITIAWLRMYTRAFVSRNLWWDDWFMLIGTVITIVSNGFLINAYHLGIGRHIYYVPPEEISPTFMWLWTAEPTNLFALYFVRVSVSLFFLRLIPSSKKGLRILIWTTIGALTVSDIYVSITYFAQCRPIQKVWDPTIPGECFDQATYAAGPWTYQAVSILVDLAIISIPFIMFRNLQVSKKTKIAIIALCCLGIFTCVCAVVKTALLPALFSTNPDKTWNVAQLCLWAPLEICVGMICGSIPCLKPLFASCSGTRTKAPASYYELETGKRSQMLNSKGLLPSKGTHLASHSSGDAESYGNSRLGGWDGMGGVTRTREIDVTIHDKDRGFA